MLRWTVHLKGIPRKAYHAAVAVEHRLYCFGGHCVYNKGHIGVHIFNTVSLRWMNLPPLTIGRGERRLEVPFKRWGHTAVLIEDTIYIWGGVKYYKGYCNVLYAFDVDTHRWFKPRISGTVPEAKCDHSACALGKMMYIYGGYNVLTGCTNDIYTLDTTTMVWSLITTRGTPAPASEQHSATVIGTKMFVFGGYNHDCYNNIGVFDTETNSWLSTPSAQLLPEVRRRHTAFAYNGELYIFGGHNFDRSFNDLWRFSPETFSWKKVVPKGKGPRRKSRMACCMIGDHIVVFGGYTPDDMYILDLSASLKTLCKLAVIRYGVEQSELPHDIRWELTAMTSNCPVKKRHKAH